MVLKRSFTRKPQHFVVQRNGLLSFRRNEFNEVYSDVFTTE